MSKCANSLRFISRWLWQAYRRAVRGRMHAAPDYQVSIRRVASAATRGIGSCLQRSVGSVRASKLFSSGATVALADPRPYHLMVSRIPRGCTEPLAAGSLKRRNSFARDHKQLRDSDHPHGAEPHGVWFAANACRARRGDRGPHADAACHAGNPAHRIWICDQISEVGEGLLAAARWIYCE